MLEETSEVTTKRILKMDRGDLIQTLINIGYDVPRNAEVFIHVPGGGDWSNMNLDVDSDSPLTITWTETTTQ